jgi:alpha-glucosidase (family GH31 glycosyl hydrolase)
VGRYAYDGGHAVAVATPLDRIPMFVRDGARPPIGPADGTPAISCSGANRTIVDSPPEDYYTG